MISNGVSRENALLNPSPEEESLVSLMTARLPRHAKMANLYGLSNIGHTIYMPTKVASLNEIPVGKMLHVKVMGEDILLSNVDGKIYATSNRCGHQNASLAKGTLNGEIVTCPLHRATFDVKTGKNLTGPQLMMSPEVMQKLPPEMIQMFQKTGEILSEIEVEPLKTYKVMVERDSIFVDRHQ